MSPTVNEKNPEEAATADRRPVRLSPLHVRHQRLGAKLADQAGWPVPEAYTSPENEAAAVRERVGVADVSAAGKLIVKGDAAAKLLANVFGRVPEIPGRMSPVHPQDEAGQAYLARLSADEFLLLTSPGAEHAATRRLESRFANGEWRIAIPAVIDQTSGLAGLVVAGPASRDLLSKLCGLSFDPTDFPNYQVAQSSLAKVHAIIVRNDLGNVPAFELYFDRSYGEYIWDSVMDAGGEFGIVPFGWHAGRSLT
jgi:sarcosine oxidase subunit alpha